LKLNNVNAALSSKLAGHTKANERPNPGKELAYPNARQTQTAEQIERKMKEKKEHHMPVV
jgi:hypothetical protein